MHKALVHSIADSASRTYRVPPQDPRACVSRGTWCFLWLICNLTALTMYRVLGKGCLTNSQNHITFSLC